MKTELGRVYRDLVTGFVGIATIKHDHIFCWSSTTLESTCVDGFSPYCIEVADDRLREVISKPKKNRKK